MGGFLLAAALLVAATLLLLLRPWRRTPKADAASAADVNTGVYRDQIQELDRDLAAGTLSSDDHAQARAELQRRALDDAAAADTAPTAQGLGKTALLLALALPLSAAALYAWLGTPVALDPVAQRGVTREDVEKMVADLAAKLEKNPDDARGWTVLARSYRAMHRLPESQAAFERIGDELQSSPMLLSEYADVLASRAMGNFEGKPTALIQRALQLDPNHLMALSLAATAAYNRNDFAQAIAFWERLQALIPADSEDGKWLAQAIAATRAQAGAATASAPVAGAKKGKPSTTAVAITGRITLAPALADKVQPTDTVFVFARAPQGSRMPLAVQRARVADLPLAFKLDDSMAMSPQALLSGATEVRIEARISRSGSATPASGDLIGVGPVVKPGATAVNLQIDQVRP